MTSIKDFADPYSPAPAASGCANPTWRHGFASLGSAFFTELPPQPLSAPYWVGRSALVARELGLSAGWLDGELALQGLAGSAPLPGSRPLASVYSGHQFGVWAGQLGDGRALLLGELTDAQGRQQEVQLKGAGRTPYSRSGDGRAVLRSSIREFLCSEAMQGLGIPTSRALCITGSDASVRRETLETAAVVTRVAPSFLRFGHFEHFSYQDQRPGAPQQALRRLADWAIARHYPECLDSATFPGQPYAALLQAVSERTARLLALWQAVGFCHGVMNTDNMSLLGLTLDYGPFQFLDAFDPTHVCNHSDSQGRYAFGRQPNVAYWNLYCLGQALLPLIGAQDIAVAALDSYKSVFPAAWHERMQAKLGLTDAQADDPELIETLLKLLARDRVDYTIFWRRLSHWMARPEQDDSVRDLFLDRSAADAWLARYARRLAPQERAAAAKLMLQSNPKFVLRNHLAEAAIRKAKNKDFSEVATLLSLLETPFDEHPGFDAYAAFPPEWASTLEISCSS
jgi:uncharacterized protein YdiU (UPF0061 family)